MPPGYPHGGFPGAPGGAGGPAGGQAPPSNFPQFPVVAKQNDKAKGNKTLLLAGGAVVLVALLVLAGVLIFTANSGPETFSASDCQKPTKPDAQGFTGCLRQLAGDIAGNKSEGCSGSNVSGNFAPPADIGVRVQCSTPGRDLQDRGKLYYVHAKSKAKLSAYVTTVLEGVGGGEQLQARWTGNALDGRYISVDGDSGAALVFTVPDRPLAGVLVQEPASDEDKQLIGKDKLVKYFENEVQPGEDP